MKSNHLILKEAELRDLLTATVIQLKEQVEAADEVYSGNYGNQPYRNTQHCRRGICYYVDYSNRRTPQELLEDHNIRTSTDGFLGYPDVSKKPNAGKNSKHTSSSQVGIPFIDFYKFYLDGYENDESPAYQYPIVWDSDREGGGREGDVRGLGWVHREGESSGDVLRRIGHRGFMPWRYKNQETIDAINRHYQDRTVMEKDWLVVQRWAQDTKGYWIKDWDPVSITDRIGGVITACQKNPLKCIEYVADALAVVALFFGPVGWVVSGVFGLVSATSMWIQGNKGQAIAFGAIEILGGWFVLVKYFKHSKKFASGVKNIELTNALKYLENPKLVGGVFDMKGLTKIEAGIVETMFKEGKYWTKQMLKHAGKTDEVIKVLKQITNLKEFKLFAISKAGISSGISKLSYKEFKAARNSLMEARITEQNIIKALKIGGKFTITAIPLIIGITWLGYGLNKKILGGIINNSPDIISQAQELLPKGGTYNLKKVINGYEPYAYYNEYDNYTEIFESSTSVTPPKLLTLILAWKDGVTYPEIEMPNQQSCIWWPYVLDKLKKDYDSKLIMYLEQMLKPGGLGHKVIEKLNPMDKTLMQEILAKLQQDTYIPDLAKGEIVNPGGGWRPNLNCLPAYNLNRITGKISGDAKVISDGLGELMKDLQNHEITEEEANKKVNELFNTEDMVFDFPVSEKEQEKFWLEVDTADYEIWE